MLEIERFRQWEMIRRAASRCPSMALIKAVSAQARSREDRVVTFRQGHLDTNFDEIVSPWAKP